MREIILNVIITTLPGKHMTVEDMVARQTRIEQQETPGCASASFDRFAANAFQSYVNTALAFSIKRGGLLYGRVDEDNNVLVDVVFEPPQVPDFVCQKRGVCTLICNVLAQVVG